MNSIRILGTGSYVPPKVLTNFDLQKMGLDTTDEWIVQRTGVSERRIADPDVCTSDLAYEASLRALDMAGMTAKDLDLIIIATITPDTAALRPQTGFRRNWMRRRLLPSMSRLHAPALFSA
jgi:3-oxoacyl-[acyl-carrier-protein] synthase-3